MFVLDPTLPVRLKIIETLTGWPESTLKDAILRGNLKGEKRLNCWCTTINAYREWLPKAGEGRRNVPGQQEDRGCSPSQEAEQEAVCGTVEIKQARSQKRVERKVRKPKRKRPTVIVHLCEELESSA